MDDDDAISRSRCGRYPKMLARLTVSLEVDGLGRMISFRPFSRMMSRGVRIAPQIKLAPWSDEGGSRAQ